MNAIEIFKQLTGNEIEMKLTVTLTDKCGNARDYEVKDKEEFLNETVTHGTIVSLIAITGEVFTGKYAGTDDCDGLIEVMLRSLTSDTILGLPYDKLLGWCDRSEKA